MTFKVGDRVVLHKNSEYYNSGMSNPDGSIIGTVADTDGFVSSLPIRVLWDNNTYNNYAEEDLELVESKPTEITLDMLREYGVQSEDGQRFRTGTEDVRFYNKTAWEDPDTIEQCILILSYFRQELIKDAR